VARVSDLTVFWVLVGVFVSLPVAMQGPAAVGAPSAPRQNHRSGTRSNENPQGA